MSLKDRLMEMLGNVEQNVKHPLNVPKAGYNATLGNFTGHNMKLDRDGEKLPPREHKANLIDYYSTEMSAPFREATQIRNGGGGYVPPVPRMSMNRVSARPQMPVFSGGGMQPFGRRYEDDYTQTQALQPQSYGSYQPSLNGSFVQGSQPQGIEPWRLR